MTDSTVRVLFLGDAAGAKKASADVDSSMQNISKSAKRSSKESSDAWDAWGKNVAKTAAVAGLAISAGIGAGLIGATFEAVKFDAAMRNVNSIAGLSEKQFQGLSKQVLSLSKSTGQGPTVLAKGLYDIVSSGFKANAAIVILKQSAIAATAGLTDTATASNAIVAALNAWHLPAVQAKNVASDLFETVNKGVVNFPQLAMAMGDLTALAPALGVNLQEVSSAFALLTTQGGDYATHGTQVKQVLSSLLKPSKDLQAAIHSLGYENSDAALKTNTFQGLLQKLYVQTGGNKDAIAKLFPDVRALAGFLGLTGDNAKKANQFLGANNKAYKDGTAQTKAFLEQQKSIAVQWQLTKAGIEAAAVPLGAIFFPALRSVLGEAGKFATFLDTLNSKKTITAKLDFVWDTVKNTASHLWQDLSDAITGDSTKHILIGSSTIAFRNDGQGLASKFWQWFVVQVGNTPTHHVVVGGNVVEFKRDPTLRDRFTSWLSDSAAQVDWSRVVQALVIGLPRFAADLSVKVDEAFQRAVVSGIKHLNWDDAKTAFIDGGKVIAAGMLQWARIFGAPLIALWHAVGGQIIAGAKSAAEFVASGGLGSWAKAGARFALSMATALVVGLAGLAGKAAGKVESEVEALPGLGAAALGKLADIGQSMVSAIVGGLSGLGASMLSAIESEISGIHIPAPHVGLGHVKAGPISIPYPTSIGFNASGNVIDHPMLSVVGEDAPRYPEFIIPTNPKYADRARGLLSGAASALGIPGFAAGGGPSKGVGAAIAAALPREKHPKKSPNRSRKPIGGGGMVYAPPGASELSSVVAAANRALEGVTDAGQLVDNASTAYDLKSRFYDQSQETFLLDVPDDPTDPTNSSTHQVRNEPDIAKRIAELTDLQGMKQHIIELMNAQKTAVEDAIAKLRELIKELLADIADLKTQIEAQVALAKSERAVQTSHIANANADRRNIATEQKQKKPNKGKIAGWKADAEKEDNAAKEAGKKAAAADKQRARLDTMIATRAQSIKDYNGSIGDQQKSLLPQGIPYNIASAGLDIGDLQSETASVSGTTGTLAAATTPATTTSAGAGAAATDPALAAQLAALQQQLAQYRLALGIQTSQTAALGSFAKGSLYVPETQLAVVHRGESIYTSDQTAARTGGASDSSQPITIHLNGVVALDDRIDARIEGSSRKLNLILGTSADVARRSNGF